MYIRLNQHLESNQIISSNQFGFTNSSSTLAATAHLIMKLKSHIDASKFTGCTFIDLKKAFDSVNHKLLIQKLGFIGIRGNSLKLFEQYLTNRTQMVFIDDNFSNSLLVRSGVPQGSLLGPVLFNFFTNDLFKLQLHGELVMYADDMVLTYGENDIKDLNTYMQNDLTLVNNWMKSNFLTINESKTKYMIFKIKNKRFDMSNFNLIVNNCALEQVIYFKYLGLWIDNQLNWAHHIATLQNKIRKINFNLYQMRHLLPVKTKFLIFDAHIMSSVRYLLPIWGNASSIYLSPLSRLINKSIKLVKNLPPLTPTRLLYNENIVPIEKLYLIESTILIYKIKNNLIKSNISLITNSSIHDYGTRRNRDLFIQFHRTTGGQNNFLFHGLSKYNQLPADIRDEPNLQKFKKYLKYNIQNN